MINCRYLIIGAGIVGMTIARELVARGINDILIIDKEADVGVHASGRNSGVLHAGIYYHTDSQKAAFCHGGSTLMKAFCDENQIPVNRCGKVIVTRTKKEVETLHTLYERAKANGASVSLISEDQLNDVEPLAKTVDQALLSHDTAVVNPKQVVTALKNELISAKVNFIFNCEFIDRKSKAAVTTTAGDIEFRYCINASGAHGETIAEAFDVGKDYRSLPFKGTYQVFTPGADGLTVNGNIYPVPDLRNPFLGVHFTRSASGEIYVGPTAIPCFGRENYHGLKGIGAECLPIVYRSIAMFIKHPGFRHAALTEPRKYIREFIYRDAAKLVKNIDRSQLVSCQKVGIRPQLIHWPTKQLVMDFLFEQTDNSLHILNAISPAFTCSMSMAKHLVNQVISHEKQKVSL